MGLPKHVKIIEVGPRDGLQNEKSLVPLDVKLRFIELLSESGLEEIEAGAFVSPKWVPQMADSEAVFQNLKTSNAKTSYSALVPNEKGLEAALRCGVKKIAVFTAASETFNKKNINCTIAESIARSRPVLEAARAASVSVRGYVSTAFVCPYEGGISPEQVLDVTALLENEGLNDISIGDTIGQATPLNVAHLLQKILTKFPLDHFAMHFHDTYGMAIANVHESLRFGIDRFDASAAGLGGCPYAPGASGNVATNDLVWFLEQMKITTGVNLAKLQEAGQFIQSHLNKTLPSRILHLL